jgi:hypothetical protein
MLQFDFHLGQIVDCLKKWGGIINFVVDDFYAKKKIIKFLSQNRKYTV